MSNCTIRQTENNFLRWTRVYGTFSIQDMQAAGGIPAGCNPADVSPIINLTATSGSSEVTLNWTNTSSSQTGVYVYRSTSSGFTPNSGNLLATLGNVETYSDTSATIGTLYYYVVVGFNNEGESTPSNEASGQIFNAFKITVKTDNSGVSNNDQFEIPINNEVGNDIDVYLISNGSLIKEGANKDDRVITFPAGAGTYKIALAGTIVNFGFGASAADQEKLIEINKWGVVDFGDEAFRTCDKITTVDATDVPNLSSTTNLTRFMQQSTMPSFDMSGWGMSNIANLSFFFANMTTFNNDTPKDWDISSLITARRVFAGSGFSSANYTDIIVGWANFCFNNGGSPTSVDMTDQIGMTFDTSRSGGANFADAGAARTYLTSTLSWTITGDTVI